MLDWLWRSPYNYKALSNPFPHWKVKWVQVLWWTLLVYEMLTLTVVCTCKSLELQKYILTFVSQVISHCERKHHPDIHRFEKISNIIKQFKLSCSKLAATFQGMEVSNKNFSAFIDVFTSNTYVMVVMSDPTIRKYRNLF